MLDAPALAKPLALPLPVEVAPAATNQVIKAQVRIALAGAMVGKHILPAGIVNDQLLDVASAAVMIGIESGWAFVRARLVHSRFWALAVSRDVPDEVVRRATPKS